MIDCLERAGHKVAYAGIDTVHEYDIVLVSMTADCDWWTFIPERVKWRKGAYRVIIGGAGILHVVPFLQYADYFILGRGENIIVDLVDSISSDVPQIDSASVIESATFSYDDRYEIAQVAEPYRHSIKICDGKEWKEGPIGCNHKCMFCGYTWQRRFISDDDVYTMSDDLFLKERAMLDLLNGNPVDWDRLRTTSIDGFSERLRRSVGKPITDELFREFLRQMVTSDAKPHQLKLYNLVGLPGESTDDWYEYIDALHSTDALTTSNGKQWSIILHSTPFRPMPCTPMACCEGSYENYRGRIASVLGAGLDGNIIFQGGSVWSVESMATDSLPTETLSMICHRASSKDVDAIERIATSRKFWSARTSIKQATLERYFDVSGLFKRYTWETLPSRYLSTYKNIAKIGSKVFE